MATQLIVKKGGGDTKVIPAPDRFVSWGTEGEDAKKEGWYPNEWSTDGTTVFRNSYTPAANLVVIPGEKNYGHIAAVGYKNGQFDLVIRDAMGKTRQIIKQGISPADVRGYFTNNQSPIAKRVASIQAGTNPDKADSNGNYAALYDTNKAK